MYLNKEVQRTVADALFFASMHMEPWDRDDLFDKFEQEIRSHNKRARESMPPERRDAGKDEPEAYRARIDALKAKRGLYNNY